MNGASLEGENEFHGRAVRDIPSADAVGTRAEQVFRSSAAAGLSLIDTKDSANTNITVNVRRTVEGIESDAELSRSTRGNDDRVLVFFGNKDRADSRVHESVDHHVVRQDIELLLIVAGGVDFTSQSVELRHTRTLDSGSDELARDGKGVEQDHEVVVMRTSHDEPAEGFRVL